MIDGNLYALRKEEQRIEDIEIKQEQVIEMINNLYVNSQSVREFLEILAADIDAISDKLGLDFDIHDYLREIL